MKKFALIGSDLSGSYSKIMHNYIYDEQNIDASYENIEVDSKSIKQIIGLVQVKEIDGLNITFPFKGEIMKYCDVINPKAKAARAVNCIKRYKNKIYGFNTDSYGFLMLLKKNRVSIRYENFYVLGSGGSALSVVYSLITLGCSKITVINRPTNSINEIKKHFKNELNYDVEIIKTMKTKMKDNACIINCTPYGTGDLIGKSPIDISVINSSHVLIDLNYNPQKTKFILDGENVGARTINGLDMLIYQGLTSIDIWLNKNISNRIDSRKIKQLLLKKNAKHN